MSYLLTTKAGLIRIDRAAIVEAAKYDGKWVIETNDDTFSLEDTTCSYKRFDGHRTAFPLAQSHFLAINRAWKNHRSADPLRTTWMPLQFGHRRERGSFSMVKTSAPCWHQF